MANIQLAVSYLAGYEQLIQAAFPHVIAAYSPFGVNLNLVPGIKLARDPVDTLGWRDVITVLSAKSAQMHPPSPAHVVLANTPPGFDRSINGQLLNRSRGLCAIFFGANSFQTPSPGGRLDLVVQVLIHEIGHLLNLTHGDGYASGGYSDALMPTSDRLRQPLNVAWQAAAKDANSRGEPQVLPPNPTYSYPFGAHCRACLRDAANNPQWWPWRSEFRDDFGTGVEAADTSLRMSFSRGGEPLRTNVGDGICFSLEFHNDSTHPVSIPTHIGPEFGTLSISTQAAEAAKPILYIADGYRCSSAKQAILPGESVTRSFSVMPNPAEPLFSTPGRHTLRIRLHSSESPEKLLLGEAEAPVEVVDPRSPEPCDVALRLVAAARGTVALPSKAEFALLQALPATSAVRQHARYKLALLHKGSSRERLLKDCMQVGTPTAIRHRAARQLTLDRLEQGETIAQATRGLRRRFATTADNELFETLNRLGDGWKALRT